MTLDRGVVEGRLGNSPIEVLLGMLGQDQVRSMCSCHGCWEGAVGSLRAKRLATTKWWRPLLHPTMMESSLNCVVVVRSGSMVS